jgi:hypothetical protein
MCNDAVYFIYGLGIIVLLAIIYIDVYFLISCLVDFLLEKKIITLKGYHNHNNMFVIDKNSSLIEKIIYFFF